MQVHSRWASWSRSIPLKTWTTFLHVGVTGLCPTVRTEVGWYIVTFRDTELSHCLKCDFIATELPQHRNTSCFKEGESSHGELAVPVCSPVFRIVHTYASTLMRVYLTPSQSCGWTSSSNDLLMRDSSVTFCLILFLLPRWLLLATLTTIHSEPSWAVCAWMTGNK